MKKPVFVFYKPAALFLLDDSDLRDIDVVTTNITTKLLLFSWQIYNRDLWLEMVPYYGIVMPQKEETASECT